MSNEGNPKVNSTTNEQNEVYGQFKAKPWKYATQKYEPSSYKVAVTLSPRDRNNGCGGWHSKCYLIMGVQPRDLMTTILWKQMLVLSQGPGTTSNKMHVVERRVVMTMKRGYVEQATGMMHR